MFIKSFCTSALLLLSSTVTQASPIALAKRQEPTPAAPAAPVIDVAGLTTQSLQILKITNAQVTELIETIGAQNIRNLAASAPSDALAARINRINDTRVQNVFKVVETDSARVQQLLNLVTEDNLRRVGSIMQIFGAQNLAGMASERIGFTLDP
ncbi:hypothetical protein HK102_008727, partial [Quaeritorhiza haematococci]